jgi:hypothetical protein
MKKVVLALVFLVLVVAVSYPRLVTKKERTQAAFERGEEESFLQIEEYAKRFDLHAYSVRQQELKVAESLWRRELAHFWGYDSLAGIVSIEKSKTDLPITKSQTAQPDKEKTESSINSTKENSLLSHKQILSYNKKRYRALPKGLSLYEKKVALAEIRDETTQKFSTPLPELDKIKTDSKLDYLMHAPQ